MGVYTRWNTPSSTPACSAAFLVGGKLKPMQEMLLLEHPLQRLQDCRAAFLEGGQLTPIGGGKRCILQVENSCATPACRAAFLKGRQLTPCNGGRQEMYSRWNTPLNACMQSRLS
jgi:hypothetical protein